MSDFILCPSIKLSTTLCNNLIIPISPHCVALFHVLYSLAVLVSVTNLLSACKLCH